MNWLIQSLVWLFGAVRNRALLQHVEYLKAENHILRCRLPKRLTVTQQERQTLLRFRKPLGAAIKGLITIVTPRTFARWLSGERPAGAKGGMPPAPRRPRRLDDLKESVVQLAQENARSYHEPYHDHATSRPEQGCRPPHVTRGSWKS